MTSLTADMAKALCQRDALPLQHADGRDGHFARGFAVHRNNVQSAPVEALRQAFPVLERLCGSDYFSALAAVFVDHHPPRSAAFFEYGAELADFIAAFPPLTELSYLADIARLEWARLRAFHAADAMPAAVDAGDAAAVARVLAAPLSWHPSVTLIESAHPLFRLWQSQTHSLPVPARTEWDSESVLVWRQGLQLRTEPVNRLRVDVLRAFKTGARLVTLFEQPDVPRQELMDCFARLLNDQVLCPQTVDGAGA